jgi:hypothetical protein
MYPSQNRQWRRELNEIHDAAISPLNLYILPSFPPVSQILPVTESNHSLCNFSTKFHSANLITVLTLPSLSVSSLQPPVPAKCRPVCVALSFKPRHLATHRATQITSVVMPERKNPYVTSYPTHSQFDNKLFLKYTSVFTDDMTVS